MTKRMIAALSFLLFVPMCLGVVAAVEPALDGLLVRYPGAARVEGEQVDASYLTRGWLTRTAAYQSSDDLQNVLSWYAAYLPQAEIHESGTCTALRQTQTFIHMLRNVSVLLCRLVPGTRIVLKEDVFLSP